MKNLLVRLTNFAFGGLQRRYPQLWAWLVRWNVFDTPQGILSWQMGANTTMLPIVIIFHDRPWLAFGLMLPLFGFTLWLHGRQNYSLITLYAVLGWIGEMWMVAQGGVWHHSAPLAEGLWAQIPSGGFLGVPFFMLPAWGLIGALMLAMQGYWVHRRQA